MPNLLEITLLFANKDYETHLLFYGKYMLFYL